MRVSRTVLREARGATPRAYSPRVAVRDRGPGLTSDQLNKLFKPFCTSKRDGLGLGLSISRSIVEMHGGCIWAENNTDKGASFYFTLPTEAATGPTYSRQPT